MLIPVLYSNGRVVHSTIRTIAHAQAVMSGVYSACYALLQAIAQLKSCTFLIQHYFLSVILFTNLAFKNEVRVQRVFVPRHRVASHLLKSLLQRSDVVFRDMFWAPYPSKWAPYVTGSEWVKSIPQLHQFGSDIDLSFVGREDCELGP